MMWGLPTPGYSVQFLVLYVTFMPVYDRFFLIFQSKIVLLYASIIQLKGW